MTDAELELAREVYRKLAGHPEGLSRGGLREKIMTTDRGMRRALELCKRLAAASDPPSIIGFDPDTQRYVLAGSAGQADRIIAYELSYIRSGLEIVTRHAQARRTLYGAPSPKQVAIQDALFAVKDLAL